MAEIFAVETRGIGRPDYTREVSLGRERPGLTLKYGESLKIFGRAFTAIPSPYSWITPQLAAGATVSLIDAETGLTLPYTVPLGYTIAILTRSHSFSQDTQSWLYIGGFLYACYGIQAKGSVVYDARVVEHGTHLIDPTGVLGLQFDMMVTNSGEAAMDGAWSVRAILKAVGTEPPPITKTVKCKFCEHEWVVPRETTAINCPNCSKLNIYLNLTNFRE